eukprot:COSAG04_NODE_950_length_9211_cov_69.923068_13_plen_57_part_00
MLRRSQGSAQGERSALEMEGAGGRQIGSAAWARRDWDESATGGAEALVTVTNVHDC